MLAALSSMNSITSGARPKRSAASAKIAGSGLISFSKPETTISSNSSKIGCAAVGGAVVEEQHHLGRAAEALGGEREDRRVGLDQLFEARDHDFVEQLEDRLRGAERRPEIGAEVGDRIERHPARMQRLDELE